MTHLTPFAFLILVFSTTLSANTQVDPDLVCSVVDAKRQCVWPGDAELRLSEDKKTLTFEQRVWLDREGVVELIGGNSAWPHQVMLDQRSALVTDLGGVPVAHVTKGAHILRGRLTFASIPEFVSVPDSIGALRIRHEQQLLSHHRERGRAYFDDDSEKSDKEDDLSIEVLRLIEDGVPMKIKTRIKLSVQGEARRVDLGRLVLEGATPIRARGSLSARITKTGNVDVFLKAGNHFVEFYSVFKKPTFTLKVPADFDEVWRFVHAPKTRAVRLLGLEATTDASALPVEWPKGSTLFAPRHASLTLKEERRGDIGGGRDEIQVDRTLWLDFDGKGLTFQDRISGTLRQDFELRSAGRGVLGRATDVKRGRDLLITKRQEKGMHTLVWKNQALDLQTVTRGDDLYDEFRAVGWDHDAEKLSIAINAPPGWTLLDAQGPDEIRGTLVAKWSLVAFLVLASLSLLMGMARGWRAGVLTFVALAFAHGSQFPLVFVYAPAIALVFVSKKWPHSRWLKRVGPGVEVLVAVLALSATVFFIAEQAQGVFAPQSVDPNAQGELRSWALKAAPQSIEEETIKTSASSQSTYRGSAVPEVTGDPALSVQTGPAVTQWSWQRYELQFDGRVSREQTIKLFWLSPKMAALLAFLRVVFALLLAALVIGLGKWSLEDWKPAKGAAMLLLLILFGPSVAQARENPCVDNCATVESADFDLKNDKVHLRLRVHAQHLTGVTIPGSEGLVLEEVRLSKESGTQNAVTKKRTFALRREKEKTLVRVARGVHHIDVIFQKAKTNQSIIDLSHVDAPKRIGVHNMHARGVGTKVLTLLTDLEAVADERMQQMPAPEFINDWYQVKRTLRLEGSSWTLTTRAVRENTNSSASLSLPLLEGEVPTLEESAQEGRMTMRFPKGVAVIEKVSTIQGSAQKIIELIAAQDVSYTETWQLKCGRLWSCDTLGIPPVERLEAGAPAPIYKPWPGEKLSVAVAKNDPAPGADKTIERVDYDLQEQKRSLLASLEVQIRVAQPGWHALKLPAGAKLGASTVNGSEFRVLLNEAQQVSFPLNAGLNTIKTSWVQARNVAGEVPPVDVGAPANDVHIRVTPQNERLIVYVFGPKWGPSSALPFRFLALLLGGALLALFLRRSSPRPWSLAALPVIFMGLTQVPAVLVLGLALLLIAYHLHDYKRLSLMSGLLVTLALLFVSGNALLVSPNSFISGIASSEHLLEWFVDRGQRELGAFGYFSISHFWYRVIMFIWTLLWLSILTRLLLNARNKDRSEAFRP